MSTLAAEACFAAGSDGLLPEVLALADARFLGGLAERWYTDPRPALRPLLLEYVGRGLFARNHQPLAKRLFKLAEAAGDDELMGRFLVALDRAAKRRLAKRTRWDPATSGTVTEERLEVDPTIPRQASPLRAHAPVGGKAPALERGQVHPPTFNLATRRYLQRRAWRYFRRLGPADPARYARALAAALATYRDEDLRTPAELLSAWGLMHALYHDSPLLTPGRPGFDVAPGKSLGELTFAPAFPDAWSHAPGQLFELALADARIVRRFALHQLELHHRAERPSLATLRRLSESPHDEAQALAGRLLETWPDLDKWTLAEWLELLRIPSPAIVLVSTRLFRTHVRPERIDFPTALTLARSPLGPVAELGLEVLKARPTDSADELRALLTLGEAPAPSVRRAAIDWLVPRLLASPFFTPFLARALLDASFADVRARALALVFGTETLRAEPMLWSAMMESPYDDVRAALLAGLDRLAPTLPPDSLRRVQATALLAVHRGSRTKPRVARQLAERLRTHPGEAGEIFPLLAVLLKSLRSPERAAGLAALAAALHTHPELQAGALAAIPGLELHREEV